MFPCGPSTINRGVLVQYQGTLSGIANKINARDLSFLVPKGAGVGAACAIKPNGNHTSETWKETDTDEGWTIITFQITEPDFHLEYYYNPLGSAPDKKMTFAYQAVLPVDELQLDVQHPFKATNFVLTPMTGKIGLLGLVFLAVFIFGSFYIQLASGPARTQTARLDPFGEIRVHLETQPDPPKTGSIPLILHITDPSGKAVAVDKAHYAYSFQERSAREMDGERVADGTFQATAALTDVGEWQVYVTLFKGAQQAQVTFILRVMANI